MGIRPASSTHFRQANRAWRIHRARSHSSNERKNNQTKLKKTPHGETRDLHDEYLLIAHPALDLLDRIASHLPLTIRMNSKCLKLLIPGLVIGWGLTRLGLFDTATTVRSYQPGTIPDLSAHLRKT